MASIIDKLWEYKRQYDEMDPYRKNQLHIAVIGSIVLVIALYLVVDSLGGIKKFFNK